jgi:hypothetical protein
MHSHNHGLYQLVEIRRGIVVLGERYEASLDSIERYLSELPQIRGKNRR